MAKTKINCLNCNIETYVENKEIARGNGKFCSRKCSSEHRIRNLAPPEPNVKCAHCDIDFYVAPSRASRSKSKLHFCCAAHHDAAQRIGGIAEILPSHYGTGSGINSYRNIVFAVKAKVCERCGFGKEPAIIVHHRDRNRENNLISNLEVLCANCHLIEHYGETVYGCIPQ